MLRNKNIMVPRETGSLRPKEDRPNLDLMYFYKNEDSLISMGGGGYDNQDANGSDLFH